MIKDAGGRVIMRFERQYFITIESFGENRPLLHQAKWFNFPGTTYPEWQSGWSIIPYNTLNASITPAQKNGLHHWTSDFKVEEIGFELNHIIPTQNTITTGSNLQLFTTPTNLPYLYTYVDVNNRCPPTDRTRLKVEHSNNFYHSIPLDRETAKLKEWVFWDGILPWDTNETAKFRTDRNLVSNMANWEGFKPNTGWKIIGSKIETTLSILSNI